MNYIAAIYITTFTLIAILSGVFVHTYFRETTKIHVLHASYGKTWAEKSNEKTFTELAKVICEGKHSCDYQISFENSSLRDAESYKVAWSCQGNSDFIKSFYELERIPNHETGKVDISISCPGRVFKPSNVFRK